MSAKLCLRIGDAQIRYHAIRVLYFKSRFNPDALAQLDFSTKTACIFLTEEGSSRGVTSLQVKKINADDVAKKAYCLLRRRIKTLSKPSHMTCQNALDSWRAAKACLQQAKAKAERSSKEDYLPLHSLKYYVLL